MKNLRFLILFIIALGPWISFAQNAAAKFYFEKIIFHTWPSYGDCYNYHMQVDSSKNVRLHIECLGGYHPTLDSAGLYIAKLSDTVYDHLVNVIKNTDPEHVKQGDDLAIDNSVVTIIIYCNGKRFYFQSQTLPSTLNNIQYNLYNIYRDVIYKKANKAFAIEYAEK